jgi:outer membrane protein assembly factor BamA
MIFNRTLKVRLLALCVMWSIAAAARADAAPQPQLVVVHGLSRTRLDTVLELLPREPPAAYSDVELIEFERRLANLGIFDLVRVTRSITGVEVELREKWTLIPMFDLSTGSTWRDTYVSLSATEYNLLGRALLLTAAAWHEARGWNGSLMLAEHGYHPTRGAWNGLLEYATSEYWFDDSDDAWSVIGPGVTLTWQAPLPHGTRIAYSFGVAYRYEHNLDAISRVKPHDGNHFNGELMALWESLRWSDYAPHGMRFRLKLMPGMFLSSHEPAPRMAAEGGVLLAYAFNDVSVLLGQVESAIMNRGNPNFSFLLGSFGGVRGLQDAAYHTWASAVLNVELRYAVRFAERWALQGVLFCDAAVFDRVDSHGRDAAAGWAANSGVGLRLIPSFLAEVVLRVDAGRAFWPEPSYFWQWGLSQYF